MTNHVDLIARFEGFSSQAFWDHKQWSIGYGSYAGSTDRTRRPPIDNISQAQGRQMLNEQLRPFERHVDSYNGRYNWTPNERAALISFAYNIGSIDQLTANGTRSKAEIAEAMLLYNKASGQTLPGLVTRRQSERDIFTGGAPIPPAPEGTVGVDDTNVANNGVESLGTTTDGRLSDTFAGAGSIADLWSIAERTDTFWDNELDTFEFYTYNLELFVIDEQSTINFLQNEYSLDNIMTDAWPDQSTKRVTIGMTGATTEFNVQDLTIESLGTGSADNSRMSGTAKSLSFSVVQVGNTSLNDSLQNASILCGFTSIHDATWYMKIKFIGYDENNSPSVLKATKVIPFKISQFRDIPSTTDARGTSTVLNGTVVGKRAFDVSNNNTDTQFEFKIEDTLRETLDSFINALNDNVASKNFTGDEKFINTYEYVVSPSFERFMSSSMNGANPNLSNANNTVDRRVNGFNISEHIGTVTVGTNIYNVFTDIINQSLEVRTALTESTDTFSDSMFVVPEVIPKKGGLNVITNRRGYRIRYHITIRRTPIIQNQADRHLKVQNSSKMINEIFNKGRCRKIYYYQYTGLNDQVLDLQISLSRQLQKTYVEPSDQLMFNNFIQTVGGQPIDLNAVAQRAVDDIQADSQRLTTEREGVEQNLEALRQQAESMGDELVSEFINEANNAGINTDNELTDLFSGDLSLQQIINTMTSVDEELATRVLEAAGASGATELIELVNRATEQLSGLDSTLDNNSSEIDNIMLEAIGAGFSDQLSERLGTASSNFESLGLDTANLGFVLVEALDTDFVTSLTDEEFKGLIETMMDNPTVFKRVVISKLRDFDRTNVFRSTEQEDIETARHKYYEGLDVDINMQKVTMTIKGDPFWLDNYITPEKANDIFGDNATAEEYRNYTVDLDGQNYCMIITNKAAGTDENDNIKIANLMISVYMVKAITNSFSGGLFTQQLELVKMPFPSTFKPMNALSVGIDTDESLNDT